MTKISAIVCTVHLRHKSKQKHTEAQQCYSSWFSLILVKTLEAVLTHCFSVDTVFPSSRRNPGILTHNKMEAKCKGGKSFFFCAKNRISKGETPKKQVGNAIGGRIACKDFSQTYQIFCFQIHVQVCRRINFKCAAIKWFEKQEEAKLIWADGMTLTLPERSKDSFMMKPSLWNLFSSILTMAEN